MAPDDRYSDSAGAKARLHSGQPRPREALQDPLEGGRDLSRRGTLRGVLGQAGHDRLRDRRTETVVGRRRVFDELGPPLLRSLSILGPLAERPLAARRPVEGYAEAEDVGGGPDRTMGPRGALLGGHVRVGPDRAREGAG